MANFPGTKVIQRASLEKVLASLDRGVPADFLCIKYGVSHAYMVALKLTRDLPDIDNGEQLSKAGVDRLNIAKYASKPFTEDYLAKQKIWDKVRGAIRRGELIKPTSCEVCGKETRSKLLHGHHEDYSKPLEVRWICVKCHRVSHSSSGIIF